jgi:hypothetical protein
MQTAFAYLYSLAKPGQAIDFAAAISPITTDLIDPAHKRQRQTTHLSAQKQIRGGRQY